MNINEINKIIIGLFFVYIVLFSSDIQLILNCGLQKMMKQNIYFRHILIFVSIYLFVFILKWYNIDVIVVKDDFNNVIEQESLQEESTFKKIKRRTSYLTNSLMLTIISYIIFIFSTKVDASIFKYIVIIIFITIIIQIISKAYDKKFHDLVMDNKFILNKEKQDIKLKSKQLNIKYDNFIVNLHNLTYSLYIISIILMIIGFYIYYSKQRQAYGARWNWNKFIFGIQKCKNV